MDASLEKASDHVEPSNEDEDAGSASGLSRYLQLGLGLGLALCPVPVWIPLSLECVPEALSAPMKEAK